MKVNDNKGQCKWGDFSSAQFTSLKIKQNIERNDLVLQSRSVESSRPQIKLICLIFSKEDMEAHLAGE